MTNRMAGSILLVLILAAGSSAAGQTSFGDSLMQKGAELYREKEYEAALETYMEALVAQGSSGPLLYNIGNAYYRTGRIGEAIRFYEKAARRMPDDPRVQHNLTIARQHVEQPIPRMPAPFWQRWWDRMLGVIGARGLLLMGLAAYLPAVGLVAYRIWIGSLPRLLGRTMWLLLTIALLGVGTGLMTSRQQTIHYRAVVISPETKLYRDPAVTSTVARTIPEGTVVAIDEDLPEWQYVRLPNGATGWVQAARLGEI